MNVETIKKEAERTKESLEIRQKKKPPMCQRITMTVFALLNYCNKVLFLCKQIEVLRDELKTIKLEMQRVKEILEQ